jgi:hypothetical protein
VLAAGLGTDVTEIELLRTSGAYVGDLTFDAGFNRELWSNRQRIASE